MSVQTGGSSIGLIAVGAVELICHAMGTSVLPRQVNFYLAPVVPRPAGRCRLAGRTVVAGVEAGGPASRPPLVSSVAEQYVGKDTAEIPVLLRCSMT